MSRVDPKASRGVCRSFSLKEKVAIFRKRYVEGIPFSRLCEEHRIHPDQLYHWHKIIFFGTLVLLFVVALTHVFRVRESEIREIVNEAQRIARTMLKAAHDHEVTDVVLLPIIAPQPKWLKPCVLPMAEEELAVSLQSIFANSDKIRFSRSAAENSQYVGKRANLVCRVLTYASGRAGTSVGTISLELELDEHHQIIWSTICQHSTLAMARTSEITGSVE